MSEVYPDNRTMTEEEISQSVVQDMDAVLNEQLGVAYDPTIARKHTEIASDRKPADDSFDKVYLQRPDPAWPTPREPVEKKAGRTRFQAEGYEDLARILSGAFDQSAHGKGKQRHSNGRPFNEQPIMALARLTGIDAHAYQISKKATEAAAMFKRGDLEAAMAEFRGVIVYAAAAILLTEEQPRIG